MFAPAIAQVQKPEWRRRAQTQKLSRDDLQESLSCKPLCQPDLQTLLTICADFQHFNQPKAQACRSLSSLQRVL